MNDHIVDAFDRIRASMDGRPDVTRTRISTVRTVDPLVGNVTTFLVESVREKDHGDTIFFGSREQRREHANCAAAESSHRDRTAT